MAVAPYTIALGDEYHGNKGLDGKPPRKRRVFVQTETGSVLGIELDGTDNAHIIKRRLQLALKVPTEDSFLVCGDTVLKDDLSTVRNDSPILLKRSILHRSSSTPCLSPAGSDLHEGDQSGPVEILGSMTHLGMTKQLVHDIVKAIEMGIDPLPIAGGLGGAYYFRDCNRENVAIVKPTDEEPFAPNNPKGFVGKRLGQPGLKRSIRVGETGCREVAAFLLDHNHFAKVPHTALVKITHSIFNVSDGVSRNMLQDKMKVSKIASFQQFIPHDFDASDYGTSSFPVTAVHRIGILDVRILNTDRHAGNLLVRKLDGTGSFGQVELVPIDHGLCLPESLEDPYFEWVHWPQASIPFTDEELEYIDNLDPVRDSEMLRMELPTIREACLRVLVLCTIFLKEAASFGLCLADIGGMMSREFRGHEEEPSELKILCIQARKLLEEAKTWFPSPKARKWEEFQFSMDYEEELDAKPSMKRKFERKSSFCPGLSVLAESFETEEEDFKLVQARVQAVSRLSMSMRAVSIGEKSWKHQSRTLNGSYMSGNRSVNEQLPASSSFVKLADMTEDEWTLFLENFQKLLHPAFANCNCSSSSQRHRLGTSCQF